MASFDLPTLKRYWISRFASESEVDSEEKWFAIKQNSICFRYTNVYLLGRPSVRFYGAISFYNIIKLRDNGEKYIVPITTPLKTYMAIISILNTKCIWIYRVFQKCTNLGYRLKARKKKYKDIFTNR